MLSTQTNMQTKEITEQPTLTCWQTLPAIEKAFVSAYVEEGYSIVAASEALDVPEYMLRKMMTKPEVKKAISEVQEALGDMEFLNERWVKSQLLRIFPMVMGECEVPMINAAGEQIQARKFVPEIAMKVLEYVTPKKAPTVQIDIHNQIDLRSAVAEGNERRKTRILESIAVTVEEEDDAS